MLDKLLNSPSLAARKAICPLYESSTMELGDSLYFKAMHTLKLLEVAEIYMSNGYTVLSIEANKTGKGESDMIVKKDGLERVVELKPKNRLESWDIFQAILYAKPGMAVDMVNGANEVGQLNPDRVWEIKNLIIDRLSVHLQKPIPSKLCKYCGNYKCTYNDQFIGDNSHA